MNYKGVLKRLLPFAATFAVAVFITSFFVDLHRPRFGGDWRVRRGQWERRDFDGIARENEELKNENLQLKNDRRNCSVDSIEELKSAVPPPPISPMAPEAPKMLKLRHSSE